MIPTPAAAKGAAGCPRLPAAARQLPARRTCRGGSNREQVVEAGVLLKQTQLPRCQDLESVCVVLPYMVITLLGVIKRGFVILLRWSLPFPPLNHERQLQLRCGQWEHPGAGQNNPGPW